MAIGLTSLLYAAYAFRLRQIPRGAATMSTTAAASTCSECALKRIHANPRAFVDSFLCLTAVGVLLGMVRALTGNIAACIGLHAGWVIVIYVRARDHLPNPDSAARPGC